MSDLIQEIVFPDSGMDQDTDKRYMKSGDSPYRLNILVSEDESAGVITNSKGNHVAKYRLTLSHTYQVVGSCYNELGRCVYYWIFSLPYDSTLSADYLYDNRLLRFNEDSETIDLIFLDTKNYMGLHYNYLMKDPFILGTWLFFNPRMSEPKMLDVDMAYNYSNYDAYDPWKEYYYGNKVTFFGGLFLAQVDVAMGETPSTDVVKWDRIGSSYQNETDISFDSEFRYAFNVIKHIPINRPICSYGTDQDKNANNVRGKVFRFTHRYKYFDNTYSRFGAYSDVTLPINDEYYNGEVPDDIDLYNYINVFIPLHSASLVKEIEIAFQGIGFDSVIVEGVTSLVPEPWKRAKLIHRQEQELLDDINYNYKFYNNESYIELAPELFGEPYDSVPKIAEAQELINKNILTYGGCTEGFDNIDKNHIDVSLTPEIETITILNSLLTVRRNAAPPNNDWVVSYQWFAGKWQIQNNFSLWYAGAGIIPTDVFIFTLNGKTITYTIQAGDTADLATFVGVIGNILATAFPLLTVSYGTTTILIQADLITLTNSIFYEPSGSSEVALTKKRGFKTGAWHPFCQFYYDRAMRRWDAQTSKENTDGAGYTIDGTTVYVPMLNEISPAPATTAYKWNIDWEVNHLPPADAKWWRWGYAGNSLCSWFVQYTINNIATSAPWVTMDISPLQTLKFTETLGNQFPQSIIDPYSWQKGDRVRIITEHSVHTVVPIVEDRIGDVVEGVNDFEIVKYEETDDDPIKYLIYVQNFNYIGIDVGIDSLVEIYRPIKTDTKITYYEFGELMPIIEDAVGVLVHGAGTTGTQNQDTNIDVPATGTFEAGDVYHILRTPSKAIDGIEGYFHESQWYSDFYDSDDWDKGRQGEETSFNERYLNIIRYSDQYLQQTQINGLSTFHGLSYKELNDLYGKILRIIESGDTLKVYQRKKPSSILIGRTEYQDAEGNTTVTISEQVLGAIRYSTTNYGTEFPESISRNNRYVYGFDVYNGVFWRDSANGIFPISGRYISTEGSSDYKMDSYFKQKAKALLVSGIDHCDVMTVWDERYKNLYVTFKDYVDEVNDDTIVFHEPSNRWTCFTEFNQTPADGWNQILELTYEIVQGFDGGIEFIFDEDTRFAIFNTSTTPNVYPHAVLKELTITPLAPTLVIDSVDEPDFLNLSLVYLTPSVEISGTYATDTSFNWLAAWGGSIKPDGSSNLRPTTITVLIGVATLISKPDWLTIWDMTDHAVSAGHTFVNGETINLFPTNSNYGGALGPTNVVIQDFKGNWVYLSVSQDAVLTLPTALFTVGGAETFSISNGVVGGLNIGSDELNISFQHNLPTANSNVWKDLLIYCGGILYSGTGNPAGIYLKVDGSATKVAIPLNRDLLSADVVTIKVGSDSASGLFVMGLQTLLFEHPEPTVRIDSVDAYPKDFNWLAAQSGSENGYESTFAILGGSPATLTVLPSWLTVRDGTLHVMSIGDPYHNSVLNGETIDLYPTQNNYGAAKPDEPLTFTDITGNTVSLIVSQDAALTAPTASFTVGNLETFTISGGVVGGLNIGSWELSISFNYDPALGVAAWKALSISSGGSSLYANSGNPGGIFLRIDGSASKNSVPLNRALITGDILIIRIGLDLV